MNYNSTIKNLQLAINKSGKYTVMYNQNQFYSKEQKRPINMYSVKFVNEDENGKNSYVEVFKSAQQLHVVLFLRNIWFLINGQDILPADDAVPNHTTFNNKWNEFVEEHLY